MKTMKEKGEDFVKKAKILFPEYDYSKVDYQGTSPKVTIVCKIHGEYQKSPYLFLKGSECSKCKQIKKKKAFDQKVMSVMSAYSEYKKENK